LWQELFSYTGVFLLISMVYRYFLTEEQQMEVEKLIRRGAAAGGVAEKVQLPKIPRPQISGSCSQEAFKFFIRKWDQYVRFFNEKDGNKLRDQLTNCPDDTLRSVLHKALGDRIDTISVTDLLMEI
jgi:hypothetical protein